MFDLPTLGFTEFFQQRLPAPDTIPARVAAEHRGGYVVWASAGAGPAQLAGRLARELQGAQYPSVGDWVTLGSDPAPGQTTLIEAVLPRRTVFVRGAAGRESRGQVVAANVDIVFVVCGLDADYNLHRIERYLARIWASGAGPVVVLNKADVCPEVDERIAEVEAACPGAPVLVTSALHSDGLDRIEACIGPGVTAALVGSSGAGKSTLINALLGEERMATGAVRAADGRGCHTTTHRQLVVLPRGGLLVDTPGMRELQLIDEEGIDSVFGDIGELSRQCRFADCSHAIEPGCAVREAVDAGLLSAERLEHYLKLGKEARAYEVRHDARLRRSVERAWGRRMAGDAKLLRRLKQGK